VDEGAGVTVEEGDVVGETVGCVVPDGDAELVGVARGVGLGVVAGGGDVAGTGPDEGCVVGVVTPAVVPGGGLNRR
jgi:hypothetical protein